MVEKCSLRPRAIVAIGEQYVFDGTASGEVEFVMADEVISITVSEPPSTSGGGGWGGDDLFAPLLQGGVDLFGQRTLRHEHHISLCRTHRAH